MSDISFKRHRFAPQIVAHAVWLYLRFNLSLREVEEMLLERGIDVSYETVRRWIAKFGPQIARNLRKRQSHPSDVWYLDEVVVKCAGEKFWLWRAVDQHGTVLEEILQKRRDKRAARHLLLRLMKQQGCLPKRIVTDKLRSYGATRRQVIPAVEHRSHKGLNNRAENSHLPLQKRERVMQGFRSPGGLLGFLSVFSAVRSLFVPPRSKSSALTVHLHHIGAIAHWKAVADVTD
ncbi:IS6 family transposase [Labrenzia sp. C1B70]|uniref:IS6 family transposase n=2 Tax=unclassified Labrenzia TaxID=2648686 RepID=UPI0004CE9415|nr:IS6 family transposase [Labrenzia sp. C1B70]